MSTRIIDEIKAIRIPAEKLGGAPYQRDIFVLCELGGDNNCFNTRTNKRARSWSAVAIGEPWQVIGEACKYAGSFEGGMTKFASGRGTPEAYIRRCRKALDEAEPLGSGELMPSFEIRFDAKEMQQYEYEYKALIIDKATPKRETEYGTEIERFTFSSAELETWKKGIHGRAWRNVNILGPRET